MKRGSTVSHGGRTAKLPAGLYGVISVKGSPSKDENGGLTLSKAQLEAKGFPGAQNKVNVTGIDHFRPLKLAKGIDGEASFKDMADKALGGAALEIADKLLGKTPDEVPSRAKLGQLISSDKTAYPQMAGRIFESALSAAIKDDKLMDKDNAGQNTWDFRKGDFAAKERCHKRNVWKRRRRRLIEHNAGRVKI